MAFLLAGGEQVDDDGDVPVRWFAPEETAQIHQALSKPSDEALRARFDAAAMPEQDIYPQIWDQPESELREKYLHCLGAGIAA